METVRDQLAGGSHRGLLNQPVRSEGRSEPQQKPAPIGSAGRRKLDGLAVRRVAVGLCPGRFAREQRRRICQPFGRHQSLERRQPVFVVTGTVIRFTARGGGLQFIRQDRGPLFPSEMSLLCELDRERERLGLPWLSEDWPFDVPRQTWKVAQI